MRVVGEFKHPACKITVFHWNNRYLLKLEDGLFEQTFKVDEFDITSEEDLKKILNDQFILESLDRFQSMSTSLQKAMENL